MESKASSKFWRHFRSLPKDVRKLAAKQYRRWLENPRHPSLQFKKVQKYWSCRVTDAYRALAVVDGDTVIWFWIGPHNEYDRLIKRG